MEEDEIPIIDIAPFVTPDAKEQSKRQTAEHIRRACTRVGFMYIQNFGLPREMIDKVFAQSKQFFSQPLEVKEKMAWTNEQTNTGYVGVARERLDPGKPGDLKEAFNMCRPAVMQWPPVEPSFRETLTRFFLACSRLCLCILRAFALALDLPENYFDSSHDQFCSTLRLLHYPPLSMSTTVDSNQSRAGEHSDYGTITLLFQDDIGGLEVLKKSGEWFPARPIPDTVLVNVGDLLMRWTNDIFKSTVHRVVIPTDPDRLAKSRYSIAFFCHPNEDHVVECLPTCRGERGAKYPPVTALSYLLDKLRSTY